MFRLALQIIIPVLIFGNFLLSILLSVGDLKMRFYFRIALGIFMILCLEVFAEVRTYELYQPTITHHTVYSPGVYLYNHCASVEFFDGKFFVVWNANTVNTEGVDNQRLLLSVSSDFINWSSPVHFVGPAGNAVNPQEFRVARRQWQPNLMNYKNEQLWCLWYQSDSGDGNFSGLYLTTLEPGASQWVNREILHRAIIRGMGTTPFAGQNPILLPSGRVIAPLTFSSNGIDIGFNQHPRFNALAFTDDGGQTWGISNAFSNPESLAGQWEVTVCKQYDDTIRVIYNNRIAGGMPIPIPAKRILTCTATGTDLNTALVVESDGQYMWTEGIASRPYLMNLDSGRCLLLHHDIYTQVNAYDSRLNLAMYFSRTGKDDFVAGPGFQPADEIGAYPQCVEANGKIYIVYSKGGVSVARDIEGVVVDPAPSADQFYIWPRDKDVIEMVNDGGWTRLNPDYEYTRPYTQTVDSRNALVFENRGTAGVEIDPVEYESHDTVTFSFETKIEQVQEYGSLVLCSFGDKFPIRIGMPADRVGRLYAEAGNGWQDCGSLPLNEWHRVTITFSETNFSVSVGDEPKRILPNPAYRPNPKLYLGDGYEVEWYLPGETSWRTNEDCKFYIDIDSMYSEVVVQSRCRADYHNELQEEQYWVEVSATPAFHLEHGLGTAAIYLPFEGDGGTNPDSPQGPAWANQGRSGNGETPSTIGTLGTTNPQLCDEGVKWQCYDGSGLQAGSFAKSYAWGTFGKPSGTDIETALSNLWSFTISCWIYTGPNGQFDQNGAYIINTPAVSLIDNTNSLQIRCGRVGNLMDLPGIDADDQWTFIAVSYDGTVPFDVGGLALEDNVKVYTGSRNEPVQLVASLRSDTNETGWLVRDSDGAMLTLGNSTVFGQTPYLGKIDEVRIWSEGAEDSGGATLPLAVLSMDEIERVRVHDIENIPRIYPREDLNEDRVIDLVDFTNWAQSWLLYYQ